MKKKEFLSGVSTGLPVVLGFVPVGIAYAIMAGHSGLTAFQTILMSVCVFAGASQMMAAGMISMGTSAAAIILATFILNLRHVIMSTCVMNRMKDVPVWVKALLCFGVTDESFAIYTTESEEKCTPFFFFGLIATTYVSWLVGTSIGCVASQFLPDIVSDSLGIALYAMFIGLLIPGVKKSVSLILLTLSAAMLNLFFSRFMASSWAVISATLFGALIGIFFVEDSAEEQEVAA